jgi:5-methyltetrahydrofolate--homocysteine methyltransferase
MGTQLMAAGAGVGACNDYLNIASPELVVGIHKRYFDAGSDCVITNSFGANRYSLKRHGYEEKVVDVNIAAGRVARQAAGEDRYVLGDIGPCGDFLEPLGGVKADELKQAFAEQSLALVEGGVDGFIVETMTAIEEMVIASEAIRSVCDLPVLCSLAYDPAGEEFRTMMGLSPADAVASIVGDGVTAITAIGFNCGTLTMEQYVRLAEVYAGLIGDSGLLLLAEPNAGRPELSEGMAVYSLSPDDYAAAMSDIHRAGATILGGCCGTSPEYIAAVAGTLHR